jgi:cytochrome d ubiquinol oxidase subunit II
VAVLAGAVILFPSLALLFRLVLGGAFEREHVAEAAPAEGRALLAASARGLLARIAVGCLVMGVGFTTIADSGWAHAIGVPALLAFVAVGFPAALPPDVLPADGGEDQAPSVAQADNSPR